MDIKQPLIIQTFNDNWKSITNKLPEFLRYGITHIQIPPVQEHCRHISPWYRVYQPTGNTNPGNSYGSRTDLENLIKSAHTIGIKIIVDVVLHHTCACPICNRISMLSGLSWMTTMLKREFKVRVLKHDRIYERFSMMDWGPRQDVEKDAILENHIELLQNLIDMDVDGFRFDAAKHIPVSHFDKLLSGLKLKKQDMLMYTESLDGSPELCLEYTKSNQMKALDFPFVFTLLNATSMDGDIRDMLHIPTPLDKVVSLADCHDSLVGDSYHFGDFTDSIIAACFLLGRDPRYSIPLIFHTLLEVFKQEFNFITQCMVSPNLYAATTVLILD